MTDDDDDDDFDDDNDNLWVGVTLRGNFSTGGLAKGRINAASAGQRAAEHAWTANAFSRVPRRSRRK